jgi:hypothetical protein
MGFIRTLLGLVVLLAIIVVGYWLYATYTIGSANDEMWVEVNSRMPDPMRKWACAEVKNRIGGTAAQAPTGCVDAWQ